MEKDLLRTVGGGDSQASDDGLTGHNADKGAAVIHHRYETLLNGPIQQLRHRDIDSNGRIKSRPDDLAKGLLFLGTQAVVITVQNVPEEIALADSPNIAPVPRQHRNGGIAMGTELFQPLPDGTIVIDICHLRLGRQERNYVHDLSSLLVLTQGSMLSWSTL